MLIRLRALKKRGAKRMLERQLIITSNSKELLVLRRSF